MVNVNVVDNTETLTLNINVVGADILSGNENMMIYGMDQATVTVTVKGSNRELKKLIASEFNATVNVSGISDSGKHVLPISVQIPAGVNVSVVSKDFDNVTLYSDFVLTKTVPFDTFFGNAIMLPESESVYTVEKSRDAIEITGPKSIIDAIESAKYCIEGDIQFGKTFSNCAVLFCDKNGDFVVQNTNLVSYPAGDIVVDVVVTGKKTIPLSVSAPGLETGAWFATMSTESATVYGDPETLAGISGYQIVLEDVVIGQTVEVVLSDDNLAEGVTFGENPITVYVQIVSTSETSE
jgi:hypothetical protein